MKYDRDSKESDTPNSHHGGEDSALPYERQQKAGEQDVSILLIEREAWWMQLSSLYPKSVLTNYAD